MKQVTFQKLLERISNKTGHGGGEVFSSFLTLAACALSQGQREEMYLNEAKRWKREHLDLFSHALGQLILEMEAQPYTDLLGETYMELRGSKQLGGEFYTPQPICRLMAKMLLPDNPDDQPFTVHETACGSGRMILAVAQTYAEDFNLPPTLLRVQAWDLSRSAVLMTHINTTLWGIPCTTIHGDTLGLEVFDSFQNIHTLLYPFPKREAKETTESRVLELGGGHEHLALFEFDKAA
jgi:methylase of polypeptide subunit release factors